MAVEEWQRHPEMQKASTNSKAATIHPAEKEQRASTGLLYTCYGKHRGNNWKFPVYCAFKEFPFCLIIGKQSGVLSVRRIEKLIASEVRTVENVNGFKEGVDQVKWASVSVIKYGSEVVLAQKAHTYLTVADQVSVSEEMPHCTSIGVFFAVGFLFWRGKCWDCSEDSQ